MTELLLKDKLQTKENEEVRNVARIRTLKVVRGLDGIRKGLVLQFLYEAGLIYTPEPIISLTGADLSETVIHNARLSKIDLGGVNLSKSYIRFGDIKNSNLQDANLQDANLDMTNFSGSNLKRAELERAELHLTNFENSSLCGAYFHGAKMYGVKLSGSDLSYADFRGSDAYESDIEKAKIINGTTMPNGAVRYTDDP
jgi:uncharacterized protein YjbI with pentapeptide repeats